MNGFYRSHNLSVDFFTSENLYDPSRSSSAREEYGNNGELLPTLFRDGVDSLHGRGPTSPAERQAARREAPRLIALLKRERVPEASDMLHAILVQQCDTLGVAPPPVDVFATATPTVGAPEQAAVDLFWRCYQAVEEQGGHRPTIAATLA